MNLLELFVKLSVDKGNLDKGLDDAEKKSTSFASKLGGGLKVAGAAIAGVATAAAGASAALVKGVSDTAAYGDNIDKMSQKMGLSAQAYQEWDAVMQHSGTSIESLQAGMKTLANAVENGNEAFGRLGITEEQIASMNQEELFSATIAGLQNVDDETERTYLAGQLLGRGATELGASLNTSAEDTEKMKQRVHELGGVMSDEAVKASASFTDNLQDLKTAFAGIKRGITAEFLPGVNLVLSGFTSLMAGEDGAEEKLTSGFSSIVTNVQELAPKIADIIGNIGGALVEVLPDIIDAGLKLVTTLATGIADNSDKIIDAAFEVIDVLLDSLLDPNGISQLFDAALKLIMSLADGIMNNLPTLIPAIVQVVMTLAQKLTDPDSVNQLIESALQIILALVDGIAAALPIIIENAPQIIINLIVGIGNALHTLFEYAPTIIDKVVEGLATAWESLKTAGGQILDKVKEGLGNVVDKMKDIGSNIVSGIWQGISGSYEWIKNQLSGWIGNVKDFIKGLFGINSPSKWAEEMLGKNLVAGFAEGIDKNTDKAYSAFNDMIDGFDSPNFDFSGDGTITHSVVGSYGNLAEVVADIAPVLNRLKAIPPNTLVGMIAPSMDEALGRRATAANRRLA